MADGFGSNRKNDAVRSNKRRLSPESPENETINPDKTAKVIACTCSSTKDGTTCNHQSPIPSCRLPPPTRLRTRRSPPHRSVASTSNGARPSVNSTMAGRKRKAARKLDMSVDFSKVPRYLWAAYGKVRAPIKRLLRRRQCGQNKKRLFPWSKAKCVLSLFCMNWAQQEFGENALNDDELSRLMRDIVSPRPNRGPRKTLENLGGGAQRDLDDIPEEAEESMEIETCDTTENEDMLEEREYVEDFAPPLSPDSEFEPRRPSNLELYFCHNTDQDEACRHVVEEAPQQAAPQQEAPQPQQEEDPMSWPRPGTARRRLF